MSDVLKRIDRLLADLKRHYEHGGLTYGEAVLLDDMISAFERIRAVRAAEDLETIGALDTAAYHGHYRQRIADLDSVFPVRSDCRIWTPQSG